MMARANRHPLPVEYLGKVVGVGAPDGKGQNRAFSRGSPVDRQAVNTAQSLGSARQKGLLVGMGLPPMAAPRPIASTMGGVPASKRWGAEL